MLAYARSHESLSPALLSLVIVLCSQWSDCLTMPIPSPRLCQLSKWPNCHGYGFHLTSQRNKPGQFISSVDTESAAEAGGLRVGDRIVEVNGVNVSLENHKQVVARIKAVHDNTNLLVVDKACDDYHRLHEIVNYHN